MNVRIALAVFIGSMVPAICLAEAIAVPAYKVGEPVYVCFQYRGGIAGWDGEVYASVRRGAPCLCTPNGCFLVVTKGRQPFEPAKPDSNGQLRRWQTQIAVHGELVPPWDEQAIFDASLMVSLPGPFEATVDIAQFYKVNEPGIYTVYWGMNRIWSEEIVFSIVADVKATGIQRGE